MSKKEKLESMFLFVTSRCNSRCRTCFNHLNLNQKNDLTFDEIKTISQTAPQFKTLWLSGGEPTLCENLADIIIMFYKNNGIRELNFPTNGLKEGVLLDILERVHGECPDLEIRLNLSIDGFGGMHDSIRGVPDGFYTTLKTLKAVEKKYLENKKIMYNIATVVNSENYDQIIDLCSYMFDKLRLTAHIVEIIRGDPLDVNLKLTDMQKYDELRKQLQPFTVAYAERMFSDLAGTGKKVAMTYYLGVFTLMQQIARANIEGPSDWKMKCRAGLTTLVYDCNGQVRACELRPSIGNIRDYGCDTSKVLYSDAMQKEINEIGYGKKANCWCTHGCWIYDSSRNAKTMLFDIPRYAKMLKDVKAFIPAPSLSDSIEKKYALDTARLRSIGF